MSNVKGNSSSTPAAAAGAPPTYDSASSFAPQPVQTAYAPTGYIPYQQPQQFALQQQQQQQQQQFAPQQPQQQFALQQQPQAGMIYGQPLQPTYNSGQQYYVPQQTAIPYVYQQQQQQQQQQQPGLAHPARAVVMQTTTTTTAFAENAPLIAVGGPINDGPLLEQQDPHFTLGNSILNLLFAFFGLGLIPFFFYIGVAFVLFFTVIGIPVIPYVLRMAKLSILPFGSNLNPADIADRSSCVHCTNITWAFFFGLVAALMHGCIALVLCLSIVFFPFGFIHAKLAIRAFLIVDDAIVPGFQPMDAARYHAKYPSVKSEFHLFSS